MEVAADLRPLLGASLVRLDAMRIKQIHLCTLSVASPLVCSCPEAASALSRNATVYKAIDDLAALSAQAANLRQPLTSCERLLSSDHIVYLSWRFNEEEKTSTLIGFAKVGRKNLFLHDAEQKTYEGSMMCLLDFYVHYSVQRKGHGKEIFDYILQNEHLEPHQIALDNPTVTLLAFVSQKYGMSRPIWQNTNFVVFHEMFASLGVNGENTEKAPFGWWRPSTPRRLGGGATETRWLDHAISGHAAKGHAMGAPVDADQTTEGTLANRANQARARKAHILSSKPLW